MHTILAQLRDKAAENQRLTNVANLLTKGVLQEAFRGLNRNTVPGIDGLTVAEFQANLPTRIEDLHVRLARGTYRPLPALRCRIPKDDGRVRLIAIPTVEDRLVQRACGLLLTQIYEPVFRDCSYGSRPQRSAHQAIARVRKVLAANRWVVHADVEGFFDHVPHNRLLDVLSLRISDRGFLRLVRRTLKAGVIHGGQLVIEDTGLPQGGGLCPILANVYLHAVDTWFESEYRDHSPTRGALVRYMDDMIGLFKSEADADEFRRDLAERLGRLGLSLNSAKTEVVDTESRPFSMLGFELSVYRDRRGRRRTRALALPNRGERLLRRLERRFRSDIGMTRENRVQYVKEATCGFLNYFALHSGTGHARRLVKRIEADAMRLAAEAERTRHSLSRM